MNPPTERGFGLIFLVLTLFIIATLGAIALAIYPSNSTVRSSDASVNVDAVYKAITGIPNTENFGYLGDVGDYPASLMDLLQAPSGVSGWNGPYLKNVRPNNSMMLDVYGSPLEYFLSLSNGNLDKIAIVSRGPDLNSSNGAANPNVASAPSPFPGAAAYNTAAGNADNVIYPDFVTDSTSVSRENAGTLTYLITNYDYITQYPALAGYQPGCPGLYNVKVTSATRPTDTISMQYPESPSASSSSPLTPAPKGTTIVLGQGAYNVSVTSILNGGVIFSERVNIQAGATVVHSIVAPPIDSSTTPLTTLIIYNNRTITPPTPLTLSLNDIKGTNIDTIAVSSSPQTETAGAAGKLHACMPLTMTVGAVTVANAWDAFLLPYTASYTLYEGNRLVTLPDPSPPHDLQPTVTLTITNGGTQSDQLLVRQATGTFLGTVYKRKKATISVPLNTAANGGTAGVTVNITKKDGSALTTNPITNPVTANQTFTVP